MKLSRISALALLLLMLTASVVAASGEESELNTEYAWDQFYKFFNLALVLVVLFLLLRKPVANFFRERARKIDESLEAAEISRREAEAKLAEVEEQIAGLEQKMEEIRQTAQQEGEAEKARIIEAAEREAEKILASAERNIENRARAAKADLKAYAAGLAIEQARELLRERIDDDEERRLLERLLGDIGEGGERVH